MDGDVSVALMGAEIGAGKEMAGEQGGVLKIPGFVVQLATDINLGKYDHFDLGITERGCLAGVGTFQRTDTFRGYRNFAAIGLQRIGLDYFQIFQGADVRQAFFGERVDTLGCFDAGLAFQLLVVGAILVDKITGLRQNGRHRWFVLRVHRA